MANTSLLPEFPMTFVSMYTHNRVAILALHQTDGMSRYRGQHKHILCIVHYVNGEAHLNPIMRKPVTISDIKQAVHPHMMDRDLIFWIRKLELRARQCRHELSLRTTPTTTYPILEQPIHASTTDVTNPLTMLKSTFNDRNNTENIDYDTMNLPKSHIEKQLHQYL